MKPNIDIENNPGLKKNPFSAPQNYFDELEGNLHAIIFKEKKAPLVQILKPYFAMAASFCLVLGLGWGIVNFVGKSSDSVSEGSELALFEEGFLRKSFVDFMYDEIDISFEAVENSELREELIENISILTRDLSDEDLYELVALK